MCVHLHRILLLLAKVKEYQNINRFFFHLCFDIYVTCHTVGGKLLYFLLLYYSQNSWTIFKTRVVDIGAFDGEQNNF